MVEEINISWQLLKRNTHCYRYVSKLWAMHALSTNASTHVQCVLLVLRVLCVSPNHGGEQNWWHGAVQMLVSTLIA
jgi:hypothetical protein